MNKIILNCKIMHDFVFKTSKKLHNLHKFLQYWALFCKLKYWFFISFARFYNIGQDFASYNVFFSKLATTYITYKSLCNIAHYFASKICFSSHLAQDFAILRKILQVTIFFFQTCNNLHNLQKFMQYCTLFCK